MTWDAPTPQPLAPPQARPPALVVRPPGPDWPRRIVLGGLAILAAVIVIGSAISSDEDDADEPAAPSLAALIRAECPTHSECGIDVNTTAGSYKFALLPEATDAGVTALAIWAVETGCLEEVDFSRIEQTRALDGMVESNSGRSTWTYHPDAGLVIVCEP